MAPDTHIYARERPQQAPKPRQRNNLNMLLIGPLALLFASSQISYGALFGPGPADTGSPEVRLDQARVIGATIDRVENFLGISYAEPPSVIRDSSTSRDLPCLVLGSETSGSVFPAISTATPAPWTRLRWGTSASNRVFRCLPACRTKSTRSQGLCSPRQARARTRPRARTVSCPLASDTARV